MPGTRRRCTRACGQVRSSASCGKYGTPLGGDGLSSAGCPAKKIVERTDAELLEGTLVSEEGRGKEERGREHRRADRPPAGGAAPGGTPARIRRREPHRTADSTARPSEIVTFSHS